MHPVLPLWKLRTHKNALVESDTSIHLCGKSGLSEDSLMKCKLMAMGSCFYSISVKSAGFQKMPL